MSYMAYMIHLVCNMHNVNANDIDTVILIIMFVIQYKLNQLLTSVHSGAKSCLCVQ